VEKQERSVSELEETARILAGVKYMARLLRAFVGHPFMTAP
jgi:hypothetical protein